MARRIVVSSGLMSDLRGRLGSFTMRGRIAYLRHVRGVAIGPGTAIAARASLVRGDAHRISIGRNTEICEDSLILADDAMRGSAGLQTRIGDDCRIGPGSIIMPGVTIGDGSVIAAGAVVTVDVPPRMFAAGNPARPIASGISVAPPTGFGADTQFSPATAKTQIGLRPRMTIER